MLNEVILMGRLTAAPDLKTTAGGTNVTSFTLAVDRRYKSQDGEKKTDFIPCVAWRETADFITRYFSKGDLIAIVGELQTRKYKDKNDNERAAFEVNVNTASFCGGKNNSSSNSNSDVAEVSQETDININDDDLPF